MPPVAAWAGRKGRVPPTRAVHAGFPAEYHLFSAHFLNNLSNNEARERLLIRVRFDRSKPTLQPATNECGALSAFVHGAVIAHGMIEMFRRNKTTCHVISDDSFVERGIMSVLISAGYEICSSLEFEFNKSCDIVLLYADRKSRISYADLCASLSEPCKLVVLAQPQDGNILPPQTLACAAAVLDRSVSQQKLLVTLDAVMMGAVVRDAPFFRPGREPRDILLPAPSPRSRLPVTLPQIPAGSDALVSPFSTREQEILSALAEGVSNKHIARKFDIAESTVKVHVKHILRKLNMNNRTQAAIWAKSYSPIPV